MRLRLLAIVCLGLFLSVASVRAQSSAEYQAELTKLAAYAAEIKPLTEGLFDVLTPLDAVDVAMISFNNGELSEQAVRAVIASARADVKATATDLRAGFSTITPPTFEHFEAAAQILKQDDFEQMLTALEDISYSVLDLSGKAIEGDLDAADQLAAQTFKRAEIAIEIGNSILDTDIAALAIQEHPQRAVIYCAKNSNNVSLALMRLQAAAISDESALEVEVQIGVLRTLLAEHKSWLKKGKAYQVSLGGQIKPEIARARGDDRLFLQRVANAIDAYDTAWPIEEELITIVQDFITDMETQNFSTDALNERVNQAFDELILAEGARTEQIFARVAMLSN